MFELLFNGLNKNTLYTVVIRSHKEFQYSLVWVNTARERIVAWEIIWLDEKAYPKELGQNPEYQRQITCLGKDILVAIQREVNDDPKRNPPIPIYINLCS